MFPPAVNCCFIVLPPPLVVVTCNPGDGEGGIELPPLLLAPPTLPGPPIISRALLPPPPPALSRLFNVGMDRLKLDAVEWFESLPGDMIFASISLRLLLPVVPITIVGGGGGVGVLLCIRCWC